MIAFLCVVPAKPSRGVRTSENLGFQMFAVPYTTKSLFGSLNLHIHAGILQPFLSDLTDSHPTFGSLHTA